MKLAYAIEAVVYFHRFVIESHRFLKIKICIQIKPVLNTLKVLSKTIDITKRMFAILIRSRYILYHAFYK